MVEAWMPRLGWSLFLGLAVLASSAGTGVATSSVCDLSSGAYGAPGGPGDTTPVARYAWTPLQPAEGRPASFNARASSDSDGDAIVAYAWNFGDGSGTIFTSTPATTHTFARPGAYRVTLGAFDCRDTYGTVTADITVGRTAVAGRGTTATAALCTTRHRHRLALPNRRGTRVLSVKLSTTDGRTLRVYRAAKLRGRQLLLDGYGLPVGRIFVTTRSRAAGRVWSHRVSLRLCRAPSR